MAQPAPPSNALPPSGGLHPTVGLGGPIFLLLRFFGFAIPIAALAIVVDALRRPAWHFKTPARRWFWVVPQALLLLLLATVWLVTAVAPVLAGVIVLYMLVVFVLQVTYLLMVVFPKHRREPEEPDPPSGEE